MSRSYCSTCFRPVTSCICHLFANVDNPINVVILQHPSEVQQSKGTVTLLANSLTNCQVLVGECFDEHQDFLTLVEKYQSHLYLLYPGENAQCISELAPFTKSNGADSQRINTEPMNQQDQPQVKCLVLLDGTWKKAYRMFMINKCLQNLPTLMLPTDIDSHYRIRKVDKVGALSSLEACCHALSMLEQQPDKYQEIVNNFIKFNEFQLSFNQQNRISPQ
jgi:DTW domain-containing protein YfiP